MSKDEAKNKIGQLVERFGEQIASYKNAGYNETLTRRDFIDPFFKALGWDIDNEQGYAEAYREVIHEDRVKIDGVTKAPDYSFKIGGGKRLFFVEAKKPSILVKDDIIPAYQIRRYGWNAKLPVSIVTDFEEFAIYDCTKRPYPSDKASVARIKYLTFKDYITEFDFLWDTFSKERVLKGSFDKYVLSNANKKGTTTVDKEFLNSLDTWRTYLATSISLNNKQLDEDEINFVVQQTIDRIIFLRIAEDRAIEPYGNLQTTLKGDYYDNLFKLFKEADQKYNAGIFDFKKDKISETLKIDNKVIKSIVNELYHPASPYDFFILPVEILGSAYEQFLGKVIRLTPSHQARIEEKPEVRKAGGVYYTPQYIVEYIVQNTVGKLIEGKTPDEISQLKIVDPACGSGSFLIGAYQHLLDHHKNYYSENGKPSKGKKDLPALAMPAYRQAGHPITPEGNLTTTEKKRILLNNIFGVDIDVNAVEVTKLSLLLKCLEGETQASIANQMNLFKERALPTLDNNIKSGNSLVDEDFYEGQLDFGNSKKVNPFNWQRAFPSVFKSRTADNRHEFKDQFKLVEHTENQAKKLTEKFKGVQEPMEEYGSGGFDCVIGNPPYVRQELLTDFKDYFQRKYRVYQGTADLYCYFFERGISLLRVGGLFGIIVANKWMRANYGEPLRKWLKTQDIKEIIDFGDLQVFENATTYPCIFIAGKGIRASAYMDVVNLKTLTFESSLQDYVLKSRRTLNKDLLLDIGGWNLADETEQLLLKKLRDKGIPLKEYVKDKIYRGVLTGLNEAFVIDEATKKKLIKEDRKSAEIIKPFLAGKDIKRYQQLPSGKYLILFPKGFTNDKGKQPKNAWGWIKDNYPAISQHLELFQSKAKKRFDQGDFWWELRACDYYEEFKKPKIILPDIALRMQATYDTSNFFVVNTAYIIPLNDKFLLGILNSELTQFFYKRISSEIRGGYLRFIRQYLESIPIGKNEEVEKHIIKLVDSVLALYKQKAETKLHSSIEQIESQIGYSDRKINELVYQLYDLSEEEIKIIEGK